jgi:hypothetical protein
MEKSTQFRVNYDEWGIDVVEDISAILETHFGLKIICLSDDDAENPIYEIIKNE